MAKRNIDVDMTDVVVAALEKVPMRDTIEPGGELDRLRLIEAARAVLTAINAAMREQHESQKDDYECETCRDDPMICASIPGLRNCAKANRSNEQTTLEGAIAEIERLQSALKEIRVSQDPIEMAELAANALNEATDAPAEKASAELIASILKLAVRAQKMPRPRDVRKILEKITKTTDRK